MSPQRPSSVKRSRILLFSAAALGTCALLGTGVALLLRPEPRDVSGVAPPQVATPAAPVAEPEAVPAAQDPAAAERVRSGAAQTPAPAAPPRGTVVVRWSGLAPDSDESVEVLVSAWRTHPGAPSELRSRADAPASRGQVELQLPGGSYSVRAAAAGRTSSARRVDLDVRSPDAEVELLLEPCAVAQGALLQHDGLPAADIAVHVVDAAGQWLGSASSGPDGAYTLECVPPVAGRLLVGALAGPWIAPIDVDLSVVRLRVPDVTLPPMGRLVVEVRDEFGAFVPDLALGGLSDSSVRLELQTDARGIAACALVPPGTWRVFGDAGPLGRGNIAFEVTAGIESRVELRLRR